MARDIDPYRTLGLPRGASLAEVKRAYRRLAKINHPDAAGPGALPRFLAIQAAYEQIAGGPAGSGANGGGSGAANVDASRPPRSTSRPSEADPNRADATRQAYGPTSRGARPGSRPGPRPGARPGSGPDAQPGPGPGPRPGPGRTSGRPSSSRSSADEANDRPRSGRGKATLGSTSYDGADTGPFEPDWGGASWYGTTSGTYWTINPKEYADPRKHGPEYQARARRAAEPKRGSGEAAAGSAGGAATPRHTTSSWWDSTAGSATAHGDPAEGGPDAKQTDAADHDGIEPDAEPGRDTLGGFPPTRTAGPTARRRPAARRRPTAPNGPNPGDSASAPDPASAAIDLGRALTDPHSGGLRGRAVRAVLGWLPIALGIGWLVGEASGCGRFAATCDPAVTPLVGVGQAIALIALLLVPEIAALAAGAALVLLAASVAASLILSVTGAAADEASRRLALGVLLVLAWSIGLAIAVIRRIRSGPGSARPVS